MWALAGFTLFHGRDVWKGSGDSNYDSEEEGVHPFKNFWTASFTMFQVLHILQNIFLFRFLLVILGQVNFLSFCSSPMKISLRYYSKTLDL